MIWLKLDHQIFQNIRPWLFYIENDNKFISVSQKKVGWSVYVKSTLCLHVTCFIWMTHQVQRNTCCFLCSDLVVGVHHTSSVVPAHFELLLLNSSWVQSYKYECLFLWVKTFLCGQLNCCHVIFSHFFIIQNIVWMLLPIHSWQA